MSKHFSSTGFCLLLVGSVFLVAVSYDRHTFPPIPKRSDSSHLGSVSGYARARDLEVHAEDRPFHEFRRTGKL